MRGEILRESQFRLLQQEKSEMVKVSFLWERLTFSHESTRAAEKREKLLFIPHLQILHFYPPFPSFPLPGD